GVWKAQHPTGVTVAIKVLPPSKARAPQVFGRFQREARLALALKHPNVVRSYQAGEDRGLHYLVMESLEGPTLDQVLKERGTRAPAEAVRLVHQVLRGLEGLHQQGLVHRDLKPADLMVVGGEANLAKATVKILDLGTVRELFSEEDVASFDLTKAGQVLG